MPNMTLAIPSELKKKMDQFPELNWSEVARKAFQQQIADFEFLKKFSSKSTMTEEEALRLGHKIKKNIALKY